VAVTQRLTREFAQLEKLLIAHEQAELVKAEISRRWRRLLDEEAAEPAAVEPSRDGVAPAAPKGATRRGVSELPAPGSARARGVEPGARRRGRRIQELADEMNRLDHRASSLAGEIRALRRRIDTQYNMYWGSVFREGNEGTRFGQQIRDFADLYTSRVSNFLHYPWTYYFQSPLYLMPHDL
jgi:hypothetical protein